MCAFTPIFKHNDADADADDDVVFPHSTATRNFLRKQTCTISAWPKPTVALSSRLMMHSTRQAQCQNGSTLHQDRCRIPFPFMATASLSVCLQASKGIRSEPDGLLRPLCSLRGGERSIPSATFRCSRLLPSVSADVRSFDDVIALEGRWPADPAWGAAYTLLPEWVGVWYDDISLFADHYDGIKQHIDQLGRYAAANNASGLLTYGLYSDWCPPQGQCRFSQKSHSNQTPFFLVITSSSSLYPTHTPHPH